MVPNPLELVLSFKINVIDDVSGVKESDKGVQDIFTSNRRYTSQLIKNKIFFEDK